MTLKEILTIAQNEVEAFQLAGDKRAHVQERAGNLYDTYIEPIDLPINDIIEGAIVDPAVRAIFVALSGTLYDAIDKRMSSGEPLGWPTFPAADPVEGES